MQASHLAFLVEEPSTEAFLRAFLPRLIPGITFEVHPFHGKADMLKNLENRLRGYARWMPDNWRIIVLVDRDDDDCLALKQHLERTAKAAGLPTRSQGGDAWKVVNRIAVEELEAWFFGDWQAVCEAYPGVSANIPGKAGFRDPDAIAGGTWEALERVFKACGYFSNGLRKIEVARSIAQHLDPNRSSSTSFRVFWQAVCEAAA